MILFLHFQVSLNYFLVIIDKEDSLAGLIEGFLIFTSFMNKEKEESTWWEVVNKGI